MSKNVKQLKELLIKQLREHQLDFNLEGEGDNEVIILSRQALVLAGSNEEFSSLIVKCMQANVKMNLLGSANEVINARITRPVFNERTVTVADQQEDLFDIPEPSNIGLIKGEALLESFDASHYDNKDPLRYIMEYSQSKSNLNSEQTQILLSEFYKEHMQHFGAHPSERPIVITNIMIKDKQVYKEFLEDKINKYNMGNLWYSLFDDIQNYYCNKCELSTIMENAKMLGLNYSVMNRGGKFYCDFGREDLILFAMELKGVDKQKYMKQQKVLSEFCRGKDLVNKPVMETGLKESLRNPSLDYKEELKKQLFEALDKNELDYKVSGEGKRQIITIPRATLVQIKDNEEICSIIIDCYKANVKLNLLGAFECPSTLRDKLNTLEVADTTYYANIDNAEKLIFNKPNHKSKEYLDLEKLLINHVTNLLNDKDISFSVEDIINSSYVVVPQFSKKLIKDIVSDIIKEREKNNSTIVATQTFFDNMSSFGLTNELSNISSIVDDYCKRVTSDELKDKEKELRQELNKKISIVCNYLDKGLCLYPQPIHDDWYINDSDGNPVVIINANEEQAFFEFMREYRHPSIKQFSQLSVDDYCKSFTKLYNSSSFLSTKELYKYLLDNNLDMREVAKIINLETNEPFPVKKILDKLDVYGYTNYELTLFCYFIIGDFTKGVIDRIDKSVQDYCEMAGKIDSSFFNTSVVNSRINEIVATAYEETKASYKDLLRIYLKTESVDKYNKELKAYNEVQEKVEKENDLVVKEELIKESEEIMSLANTYKFSETSITNVQVSRLEMEMSNKIYKMAGEKLYYKYFHFISLSCIAGSRRIVYIADKDNAKYGNKTITEEMSKSISLGNTPIEPNRTIVIGMDYNYTLSLAPEYRCKLARRILRKDVFFGFATDIMENSKIKDYFEISCRKREANGILIDTVLLSHNDDLVLLRDGEFTSLKDVNYEVFALIADFMKYGIVACLDTKAYDKIIGFYKRNNYSDSVINKIVNLSKFMTTVYDGFTLNENDMKLIVKKNGVSTVTPINRINYKVNKLVYVK